MAEWMEGLRTLKSAYLGVFGVPDYETYLRHMAERHPGQAPLDRESFAREFIDRRYGAMRPRCC